MLKDEIDMALCPRRVGHKKGSGSKGESIVVHKEAVVPGRRETISMIDKKKMIYNYTYRSLIRLRMGDEDIRSSFVCHACRERTRASISVLIVG